MASYAPVVTSTPAPGEELRDRTLGGRYRMLRLLGRGGMGAVWVAHDLHDDVDVAIKVVKAALLDDAAALARFRREMAVMAGLAHDNIVRGLAAGEDDGVLWLAMELLHGQTLRERLDGRGRLPWQESLTVVRQIVRGLGAAHGAGVVHRDLKPENIMLVATDDGSAGVKLLDFGVAKAASVDGAESSMTGTGFIIGTPGYVAPEVVLDGKTNDPRSDFYALGVVWFEMVTGQKPFTAKTPFALAMRHAHEKPPAFNLVAPFAPVPAPVEAVVGRLLEKSPEERPPDTATLLALVDGLERAALAATDGTPVPDAFEPTLTDVRATLGGTAVVPLRLPSTATTSSQATPSTGLAGAAPALPGSELHLFRQLPLRMKVALVAGAVLLPLAALAVLTVVLRGPPTSERGGASRPIESTAGPVASSDHDPVRPKQAAPQPLPGARPTEDLRDGSPEPRADQEANDDASDEADAPAKHGRANERRTKRASDGSRPRAAQPTPAPPSGGTFGRWSMSAPGAKVKLVVDGTPYQDPPFNGALLLVGMHELVVLDGDSGELLQTRPFEVTEDDVLKIIFKPDGP